MLRGLRHLEVALRLVSALFMLWHCTNMIPCVSVIVLAASGQQEADQQKQPGRAATQNAGQGICSHTTEAAAQRTGFLATALFVLQLS